MDTLREHLERIRHIRTAKKSAACRANGKLGGRPRKQPAMTGIVTPERHLPSLKPQV